MKLIDIIADVQANGHPEGQSFLFDRLEVYTHRNQTFVRVILTSIIIMVGSRGYCGITNEIHIPIVHTSEVYVNCNTITFGVDILLDVSINGRVWACKTLFSEIAKPR